MLVPPKSSSAAVLVMIRSKSVSICNHSRARLVDSSRNGSTDIRTASKFWGCPHIGGHHEAKNGGCPDTVNTNGLTPMLTIN